MLGVHVMALLAGGVSAMAMHRDRHAAPATACSVAMMVMMAAALVSDGAIPLLAGFAGLACAIPMALVERRGPAMSGGSALRSPSVMLASMAGLTVLTAMHHHGTGAHPSHLMSASLGLFVLTAAQVLAQVRSALTARTPARAVAAASAGLALAAMLTVALTPP